MFAREYKNAERKSIFAKEHKHAERKVFAREYKHAGLKTPLTSIISLSY